MNGRPARIVDLTRSQRAVLAELMRDGAGNAMIGRRLNLDIETVKSHLKKIMSAARIHSRTELVLAVERRQVLVRRSEDVDSERISA